MNRRIVSGITLTLLLTSLLTLTFNIQPIKAWDIIYICSDGSISPEGAPITTSDNITYRFTGNIVAQMIWIKRGGIIVDGNNKTLQAASLWSGYGFYWSEVCNVTIRNTNIKDFMWGVFAHRSYLSTIIRNNIINNYFYGVYLFVSSNCRVSGNNITLNRQVGVGVDYDPAFPSLDSKNHTVSKNNITGNSEYGVYVRRSSSCNITGNNMTNNKSGLGLVGSSDYNQVSDNKITSSTYYGIYIDNASFNNVTGNTFTSNFWSIGFSGSSNNNTIFNNEILKSTKNGVTLAGLFNTISWNRIINSATYGIMCAANHSLVSGNTITNNTVWGITNTGSYNTFFGNYLAYNGKYSGSGAIELTSYMLSAGNVVVGNRIENNAEGIVLDRSSNNVLKLNTMVGNKRNFAVYGSMLDHFVHDVDTSNTVNGKPVYYLVNQRNLEITPSTHPDIGYLALVNSAHVTVSGLELKDNGQGLLLAYTTHSRITENSILDNNDGVYFYGSSFNIVSENNITSNSNGIRIQESVLNNVFKNNMTENSSGVNFWERGNNNTVSENSMTNCSTGVRFYKSHGNIVSGNNIANSSSNGIYLFQSFYNTISGNNLTKNAYAGVLASGSYHNRLYHNNIVENTNQVVSYDSVNVWNNGYPSGGNYWSDYTGVDVYRGIYQNETGSDGIGDTPRLINAQNQDQYPLMTPSARIYGKIIFEGTTGTTATEYKIGGVEVHLTRGYDYLETVYTDLDGNFYCSTNGETSELKLIIVLKDKDDIIKVYDFERDPSFPAFLRTPAFQAETSFTVNITMTIDAHNAITYGFNGTSFDPQVPDDTNVGADRFAHLAVIYHNTYTAVLFATSYLGLTLDYALPVDVRAFSPVPATCYKPYEEWFDPTDGGWYPNDAPGRIHFPASTININAAMSYWNDPNAPDNREWHEFAHHIMADSLICGENQLSRPQFNDSNHRGYFNAFSTDALVEGFAEFTPMLIADAMKGDSEPSIYGAQPVLNFEVNYPVWEVIPRAVSYLVTGEDQYLTVDGGGLEELAVASILWDIYDGVDATDNDNVGPFPVIDIWNRLITLTSPNPTVYDLYNSLQELPRINIPDLDTVFVAHDCFIDANGNCMFDAGETIGKTSWGWWWNDADGDGEYNPNDERVLLVSGVANDTIVNVLNRYYTVDPNGVGVDPDIIGNAPVGHFIRFGWIDRRALPPIPGSFIEFNVTDADTGYKIPSFIVEINETYPEIPIYNYIYRYRLTPLDKVSLALPSNYNWTVFLTVSAKGYENSSQFSIDKDFFWTKIWENAVFFNGTREVMLTLDVSLTPKNVDIAITNVDFSKAVVGQGYSMPIKVTVTNQGESTEAFNITAYANTTTIETREVVLSSGNSSTITINWDTTSFALGSYIIWAYAEPLPDETSVNDNTFVGGWVMVASYGWEHEFTVPTGHPVVDFDIFNGTLYAAANNTLYAYNGVSWNTTNAPTFITSLEPYEEKLIVGGQGGLYCYDGTSFSMIFTVPTYIKVLGAYNNKLYAGTMLANPPTLYYCNGSVANPSNWHVDTDFSAILNFSGVFGSINSFTVFNNVMYVGSGGKLYSFNGTDWNTMGNYDDVGAFLDMQIYDGKLYLATKDQAWRKPFYQGGTGFSGRVLEFDGENWTTVLDHDYWVYSLGVYDGKLYAGTANKIFTYDGTSWETSFNAAEGAYYALCFENYDDKIYVGMGNGYIFADPAPPKPVRGNIVVPEFPSAAFFAVFAALTVLPAVSIKKKRTKKTS